MRRNSVRSWRIRRYEVEKAMNILYGWAERRRSEARLLRRKEIIRE